MENLNCDVRYDEAKREVSVITKEEEPKDNVSDPDKNLIEDLINKPIKKPIIIPEEEINNQEEEKEVVIKNPTEIISIKGPAIATSTQLRKMASEQEGRIKQKMENSGREFVPFPDVIDLYLEIGKEYGIRGDLAYAQALKETGYFQFTGQVLPFQNNYCGLWATGVPLIGDEHLNLNCIFENDKVFFIEGLHGLTFLKPEYGVEAHIQHLYAYVTKDDLPPGKKLVDPRFHHVNRGIAINWQDLNGRWAVPGVGYGESIIDDYWAKHKN